MDVSGTPKLRPAELIGLPTPARRADAAGLVGWLGLSARLFLVTVAFVALAELVIYVPAIANHQRFWLSDRIAAAQAAALVLEAAPQGHVSAEVERHALGRVGTRAITLRQGASERVLTMEHVSAQHTPAEPARRIDLRETSLFTAIGDVWFTFVHPGRTPIQVVGRGDDTVDLVEILLDEAPLRSAMLDFAERLLVSSLVIAAAAAGLVFVVLQIFIVRPVLRLARNITDFAQDPERADRVIAPSQRTDEIGHAEAALAKMEITLSGELRHKRRLAELGLSVSKINHELRNLLTTAQLLGDRLDGVPDPVVQRVAPRLVGTLGRAIRFCEATLAYGRAAEQHPQRRVVPLAPILADLSDLANLATKRPVTIEIQVAPDTTVDADPDQLARVLANLVRNAVQALDASEAGDRAPSVTVEALREASREGRRTLILVRDNGPGLPARTRAHLFEPFHGSARAGGTGLGLAIAAELVSLHGGTLSLDPSPMPTPTGTCFRIVIPDSDA